MDGGGGGGPYFFPTKKKKKYLSNPAALLGNKYLITFYFQCPLSDPYAFLSTSLNIL